VSARTVAEAIEQLDEIANAEGCPITRLSRRQVHFTLTDEGRLALEGMCEATEDEIFEFCYLELDHALAVGSDVAGSVNRERNRVHVTDEADLKAPETQLGQTGSGNWTCPRRWLIESCPLYKPSREAARPLCPRQWPAACVNEEERRDVTFRAALTRF